MFQHHTNVRMYHMDAAQSFFYANLYILFHDTLEAFLKSEGFRIEEMLHSKAYALPVVHAEGDFLIPVKTGDKLLIEMSLGRIGESSLTLLFHVLSAEGMMVARGKIIHVTVSKATNGKIKFPQELREIFNRLNEKTAVLN